MNMQASGNSFPVHTIDDAGYILLLIEPYG